MKLLGSILTVLALASQSYAGCQALQLRSHGHHHAKAVVLQQYPPYTYNYAVSQETQLYAMLRLAAEAGAREAAKNQVGPGVAPSADEATVQAPVSDRYSIVRAECSKCHAKPNSEAFAALDLSDLGSLTCEQVVSMNKAVLEQRMPPAKKLDGQTIADLLGQLNSASNAPGAGVEPPRQQVKAEVEQTVLPLIYEEQITEETKALVEQAQTQWKYKFGDIVYPEDNRDVRHLVIGREGKKEDGPGWKKYRVENLENGVKGAIYGESELFADPE